jgi:hypothetical protein
MALAKLAQNMKAQPAMAAPVHAQLVTVGKSYCVMEHAKIAKTISEDIEGQMLMQKDQITMLTTIYIALLVHVHGDKSI